MDRADVQLYKARMLDPIISSSGHHVEPVDALMTLLNRLEHNMALQGVIPRAGDFAFEVRSLLPDRAAGDRAGCHRWISSGDVAHFAALGRQLLGPELAGAEAWTWA